MKIFKQIMSFILCVSMLIQIAPTSLAEEYISAPYEAVETERGTTLRDQVIDGNLVMDDSASLYVAGTITLKNGDMIITGGQHEIGRDAVIRGNIVVAGPAELIIDGIVEGEVRLEWACWSADDARWMQDDLPTYLHIELGEHAVVSAIQGGSFQGSVYVCGSVTTVEMEDTRNAEEVRERGYITFSENAFASSISAKGSAAPSINIEGSALIDQIQLLGGSQLNAYGGRINELIVKNGASCYLGETEIETIDASGEGVWIVSQGSTIGQVSLSNSRSGNIPDWYNEKRTVMTAEKGTTIESVTASGLSSFTVSNIMIDEAEQFADQPIASLDREQLFKESRVGSVVTSGAVCLENNAYIESVILGRGANMWGSGMTERLEATDASIGFYRRCELNEDDFYHNRVRGVYNEEYYQGISVGFASIKGGSFDLAEGTGAKTVIVEDAYVNLGQFHQIENLVLNNVRSFYVAEDEKWNEIITSFEKEERIGRLFFNSSSQNVHRNGLPTMHIGTLSIYGSALPVFADIDKLLLPNGQKDISSGLQGRAVLGMRPDTTSTSEEESQMPEDAPEASQEELDRDYYVGSVSTIQTEKGKNSKEGSTSRSKAQKLQLETYQICKTDSKDWWYTIETDALQTLNITLDAVEGMGTLVVYGPDDQCKTLVSEQNKAELSVVSIHGGVWTLRLIGAQNDYMLNLGVSDPIRVALDATLQPANSKGDGKKASLDLTAYSLEVENMTKGTHPVFFVTQDSIVMATDQGDQGDTLRITLSDPKDAFIPVSADVQLNHSMQGKAKLETAEYSSYAVTCQDAREVYMHLYDNDGAYVMTLSSTNGTYRANKLLPGTYHLVMIRGSVGRWRFSQLSDYAAFGLKEKRDYRLDTFTLRMGYTDSYPGATVPEEPVIDSAYVVEESSRFDAAKSVCLENSSVLMRVEYELENAEALTECTVEIELSGIDVDTQAITINGKPTACTLENDVLCIPVQGQTAGKIAFYAHSTEQKEMLAIGRLRMQTSEGSELAYLGSVAIEQQKLSVYASPESGGTVNLFGYGVPGETLTILRDGVVAAYAECNMNGQWNRTLHVEPTVGYESYHFTAAVYTGTENELISEPVTVRVQQDTPTLTGVEMYYYEHEYQRKLRLSAEQFYRGGLSFSYLPGSAFTIKFTFDKPERIEEMDLVLSTKMGDTYVFPCEFNSSSGVFTASGEFPKASMSNTLRLNWRLSPLSEPTALPAFDRDSAEQALQLEINTLDARVEDDYLECDMQFILGGKDLGVSTLHMELAEVDYDTDRLEEEALMCYDLGTDGIAYLMGDEQHPESLYLICVNPQNTTSLRMNGFDKVLTALISSAHAEEGEESVYQTFVDLGAMIIFDFTTGLGGSVVEVMSYDTMMVASYVLRNKVDERWQEILREIESETNPERLLCLSELAMQYANLYNDCTNTAHDYANKAKWDGLAALGGKLLKPDTVKATRDLYKALKNWKDTQKVKQSAIKTYKSIIKELDNDIKDMYQKLPDWMTTKGRDGIKKTLIENKDKFLNLKKAFQNKSFNEQFYEDLHDLLAFLGRGAENAKDIVDNITEYLPKINELFDAIADIYDKEEALQQAQDKLQQEEDELEQIDAQLSQSAMDMAGTMANGVFNTIVDAADGLRNQFSEDYEKLLNRYYLLSTIDCPQPTPSPTPSVAPTNTPSPTSNDDPTATLVPDSTPTPVPTDTPVNPNTDNPPGIEVVIDPIPDPSGYVYEGMWSNRITGVQAIAYTRDAAGEVVQWDAEPYGQKNPTLTNEQGYYEWYVPEGDWMVVYQKDGYETAQSDWMAVPPPQTEVHQNLISYEPPQLIYAKHYGNAVEVSFSKPIRIDSVSSQTLSIGADFTVQAINPERYGETDIVLATLFQLVPKEKLPRNIQVEVSSGVISYIGVPCEQTSLECTQMERLISIEAPAIVNAQVGTPIMLTIQAYGGDFENYHLLVSGAHEDLLRIDSIGSFDAAGRAVIEMTPLVSGVVLLDICVQDTRIATAVKMISTDQ